MLMDMFLLKNVYLLAVIRCLVDIVHVENICKVTYMKVRIFLNVKIFLFMIVFNQL